MPHDPRPQQVGAAGYLPRGDALALAAPGPPVGVRLNNRIDAARRDVEGNAARQRSEGEVEPVRADLARFGQIEPREGIEDAKSECNPFARIEKQAFDSGVGPGGGQRAAQVVMADWPRRLDLPRAAPPDFGQVARWVLHQ